jgi:ribosomal protein L11 methyltransferase
MTTSNSLYQITIQLPATGARRHQLLAVFAKAGVATHECVEETSKRSYVVTYYCKGKSAAVRIAARIKMIIPTGAQLTVLGLTDTWKYSWQNHLRPMRLMRHIRVFPPHHAHRATKRDIVIDSGFTFGAGNHPTTRLVARALETYMQPGASFLDIGTGTGILSILAARLGASHVTAIDVDKESIRAARINLKRNNVKGRILHTDILTFKPRTQFNCIVSNIPSHIHEVAGMHIAGLLTSGGYAIISGMLVKDRAPLARCFRRQGFRIIRMLSLGGWGTIICKTP